VGFFFVVVPAFTEEFREALIRAAELCAVKKHLENPPAFEVTTRSLTTAQG